MALRRSQAAIQRSCVEAATRMMRRCNRTKAAAVAQAPCRRPITALEGAIGEHAGQTRAVMRALTNRERLDGRSSRPASDAEAVFFFFRRWQVFNPWVTSLGLGTLRNLGGVLVAN